MHVQPTSSSTVSRASFNSREKKISNDRKIVINRALFFSEKFPLSFFFSKGRKFLYMFNRRAVQQFLALVLILEEKKISNDRKIVINCFSEKFLLSLSSFQREENSYVCSTDEQFNNFAR